jgi:ATP-dependent RNA helicase DDX27
MDFIRTIDSDDEKPSQKRTKKPPNDEEEARIDPDFQFDLSEDPFIDLLQFHQSQDVVRQISKPVSS